MAFIDRNRGCLTIRIVVDGPAEAGKTATVEALAASFGEQVVTPEERDRRTLYFDWVDYTAGRFGGRPIRCQIVTVPGQAGLRDRRVSILETADAVVFVADSRPQRVEANRLALEQCCEVIDQREVPPKLLLQANHRDAPDAVDPQALFGRVGDREPVIVETVASESRGVREVFIHAVRLALDRVRRLDAVNALTEEISPQEDSAQALFNFLSQAEPAVETWSEQDEQRDKHLSPLARLSAIQGTEPAEAQEPLLEVAEGTVWPPLEGRMFLAEAQTDDVKWTETDGGGWVGVGRKWLFRSEAELRFSTFEAARERLVLRAKHHGLCRGVLSPDRCLVVTPEPEGSWRLWQVLRRQTSIQDLLERTSWAGVSTQEAADLVSDCWAAARWGVERVESKCPGVLDLRLESLRPDFDGEPYVGPFRPFEAGSKRSPLEIIDRQILEHMAVLTQSFPELDALAAASF